MTHRRSAPPIRGRRRRPGPGCFLAARRSRGRSLSLAIAALRVLRPPWVPAVTAALLITGVVAATPLTGQDRLARRFDARDGLTTPTVLSLAQDSTGFVWIGTVGGVYRYDGVEVRRRASARIRGRVHRLEVLPSGKVLAAEERGELWRLEAADAVGVEGPDGEDLTDVVDVSVAGDGSLWVLRDGGRLVSRGSGGGWRRVPLPGRLRREDARYLFPRGARGVDLATARALWTIPEVGPPRRVAEFDRVQDVLSLRDGRRVVVTFWRDTYLVEDGRIRRIADPPGRGIDAARRGAVVWIAYDRYLVRMVPGGEAEVVGPGDGLVDGAGALLVDHEGSLWTGTQAGLVQFPEPETTFWVDHHGIPSAHTRFVERAGDSVWVTTWQGVGRVERAASGWRADTLDGWISRADLAVDGEGDVWIGSGGGLLELRAGRPAAVHDTTLLSVHAVAEGEDDALWLGGYGGIRRVRTAGFGAGGRDPPLRARGLDVEEGAVVTAAMYDDADRLWVAVRERICRAYADSVVAAPSPDWTCWTVPGSVHFSALQLTDSGAVWAASPYAGVLELRDGRWRALPGVPSLPSRSVLNLVPSPSGGVWMVGHAILQRVRADPSAPEGWRVLERLSAWHGVPAAGGEDVHEDPDGTLWITTSRGLVRVPPNVRRRTSAAPRVALIEARVDDERVDPTGAVELPHDRNRLELRFAALSYRAPSRLRYQVRLSPGAPWSDARAQPVVRWVDLDAGSYRAEIRASLGGTAWTPEPAAFAFDVLPPWYLQPRWIVAFALAAALVLFLLYRARVAHLLGLERQRTRIAMDLHDEMGAALGSIGIQAGMLARRDVDATRRLRLAGKISETAEDLGTTLADMIWSLDPRPATLRDLALRLEERGRRLFGDGSPEFSVLRPDRWPEDDVPASVRRNALLVGLEALQNAARHADADRVVLALTPERRGVWRLSVRDDGRGMADARAAAPGEEPAPAEGGGDGMGLVSMRTRAEEVDGKIRWSRSSAGGTEVTLIFPLRGRATLRDRLGRSWARLKARMNVLLRRR